MLAARKFLQYSSNYWNPVGQGQAQLQPAFHVLGVLKFVDRSIALLQNVSSDVNDVI